MVKLMLSRMHRTTFACWRYYSTKSKVTLDETTATLLSNDEIKYRDHPGIVKPRIPTFPNWVESEIRAILKERQITMKMVNEGVYRLNCHLKGRRLPVEQSELNKKLLKVEELLKKRRNGEVLVEDINFRSDKQARNILKQHVYNWQPISFDKYTCVTYLLARSVQNYTVTRKIFNEIKARDENFKPKTLFDFGSGIGTVIWAASEIWSNSLNEYFCVDTSETMIDFSTRLVKAAKPKIKNVYYRQFFPSSNTTYDIVVSAYSLFELPGSEARLEVIYKLWKKTERYLVIIEQGTPSGFKLVTEARDFILNFKKLRYQRETHSNTFVFAPCPHDLACQKYITDDTPCNFNVLYHPLRILGSNNHKTESYSYVVLKKGKRPEDDEQWPRIVEPTLKRSRHVICRMCVASGELKEEIFTRYKHGRDMYRCARTSELGDRLPMHFKEEQEISEEDDDTTYGEITEEIVEQTAKQTTEQTIEQTAEQTTIK